MDCPSEILIRAAEALEIELAEEQTKHSEELYLPNVVLDHNQMGT